MPDLDIPALRALVANTEILNSEISYPVADPGCYVPVSELTALLDAAEQWEAPSAEGWKRARLERDALRRDRDRLRRAISDFLATYTLHTDITRGLAAVLTSTGEDSDA